MATALLPGAFAETSVASTFNDLRHRARGGAPAASGCGRGRSGRAASSAARAVGPDRPRKHAGAAPERGCCNRVHLVDGNTFINCQREIALGLIERTPNDHSGGLIRNNFIYRSGAGDSAIYVADSPNTQVLHNSIFISGTYANPIEYRFPHTTGVVIANNVLDGGVQARDGAAGLVSGNHTIATAALFVNAAVGDLHLKPTATALLNRIVTPLANAAVDWNGHARPAGGTDVGADEFVQGTGTPPGAPEGLVIVR